MKLDPYLIPYTKFDSKRIKDLNVRDKIINLLEKKHRANIYDLEFGNDFLYMTPKAQATKENIDKSNFIKK